MKRLLFVLALSGILLGVVAYTAPLAQAQSVPTEMTQAHIDRIRENCVTAQATMDQLRRNGDTPLRVNRGQLYEFMTRKLMIPLNNRLAVAGYDTVRQVMIVNDFQRDVETFKTDYLDYRDALVRAISIKCADQPVTFYDSVADARAKRLKVNQSVQVINQRISDYKSEVEAFTRTYKGQNE